MSVDSKTDPSGKPSTEVRVTVFSGGQRNAEENRTTRARDGRTQAGMSRPAIGAPLPRELVDGVAGRLVRQLRSQVTAAARANGSKWKLEHRPSVSRPRADDYYVDMVGWRSERYSGEGPSPLPDFAGDVMRQNRPGHRVARLDYFLRLQIPHVWFIEPDQRLIEAYSLGKGVYVRVASVRGNGRLHAPPFAPLEVELERIWLPPRQKRTRQG